MPTLTEQATTKGNIMVVDDNPANLKLLEDVLLQHGYDIRSFPRGRLALAAANEEPPDLILLDINMPEMNGYEVCERLKSNAHLSGIPVISLSALNETEDKVNGFRSGGADYISKPFQFEEVQARVETHIKLHRLQRALKLQNEYLEQAVAARTRELAETNERLTILDRSKNDFLNLISHEFRTPLNGLLGVSEIVLEEMPSTAENNELRAAFEQCRLRILSILDDALLLTQIDVSGEQFQFAPVSLSAALSRAIESTTAFAKARRVALSPPSMNLGFVVGDEELLVRALHALLETAVKFSEVGGIVLLKHQNLTDSVRVSIESHGMSIPGAELPKFFDVFLISGTGALGVDLGLGPAVAFRILSLFSASVSVENREPSGIRLIITLRAPKKPIV
jgi:DNA-binding response OmpR family regulator